MKVGLPAPTFAKQSDLWLERLRTRKRNPIKESSLASYSGYLNNWIRPHLGQVSLAEFGALQMREFVSQLALSLGPKTVNEVISVTKQIVSSATDSQGLPLFPRIWDSDFIDLPVVDPRQQRTPTVTREQIEGALATSNDTFRCLIACLAGSGLRINEALAIKLGDSHGPHTAFDPASSTIYVRRGLWRGREQDSPKTPSAIRSVEIPQALGAMLAEFAGRRDGYLFGNGRPLSETTARERLAKQGLPGFHSFRRYRTTVLRAARCPEDITKYWLGHSGSGSITDRYSKLSSDIQFRRVECDRIGLGFKLPDEVQRGDDQT